MSELDDLLEIIDVAPTDSAADAARGERALRRRRRTQVSAAALSVVAVAAIGVAAHQLTASPRAEAGFAGGPGGTSASAPHHQHATKQHHSGKRITARERQRQMTHELHSTSSQDLLQTFHDVLADHLDPHGDLLAPPSNEQSSGGSFGSKLDWNHGGMLEILVGHSWGAADSFYQLDLVGMTPTTYDGHPARVSTTGDDLVVSVEHDDGTIVTLIASTGFGNNGTSTSVLGLTRPELLAAAADHRLALPAGGVD